MTPLQLWFAVGVVFLILWAVHSVVTWALNARSARTYTDHVISIEERRKTVTERQRLEAAFRFGGRPL